MNVSTSGVFLGSSREKREMEMAAEKKDFYGPPTLLGQTPVYFSVMKKSKGSPRSPPTLIGGSGANNLPRRIAAPTAFTVTGFPSTGCLGLGSNRGSHIQGGGVALNSITGLKVTPAPILRNPIQVPQVK